MKKLSPTKTVKLMFTDLQNVFEKYGFCVHFSMGSQLNIKGTVAIKLWHPNIDLCRNTSTINFNDWETACKEVDGVLSEKFIIVYYAIGGDFRWIKLKD